MTTWTLPFLSICEVKNWLNCTPNNNSTPIWMHTQTENLCRSISSTHIAMRQFGELCSRLWHGGNESPCWGWRLKHTKIIFYDFMIHKSHGGKVHQLIAVSFVPVLQDTLQTHYSTCLLFPWSSGASLHLTVFDQTTDNNFSVGVYETHVTIIRSICWVLFQLTICHFCYR